MISPASAVSLPIKSDADVDPDARALDELLLTHYTSLVPTNSSTRHPIPAHLSTTITTILALAHPDSSDPTLNTTHYFLSHALTPDADALKDFWLNLFDSLDPGRRYLIHNLPLPQTPLPPGSGRISPVFYGLYTFRWSKSQWEVDECPELINAGEDTTDDADALKFMDGSDYFRSLYPHKSTLTTTESTLALTFHDEPIGYVQYVSLPSPSSPTLITNIEVDSAHRRRGHARRLLQAVFSRQPGPVLIRARIDNFAAVGLYSALGLKIERISWEAEVHLNTFA